MKSGQMVVTRSTEEFGVVLSVEGAYVTALFPGKDGWPFPERRTVARKDVRLTRVQQAEQDFEPAPF